MLHLHCREYLGVSCFTPPRAFQLLSSLEEEVFNSLSLSEAQINQSLNPGQHLDIEVLLSAV